MCCYAGDNNMSMRDEWAHLLATHGVPHLTNRTTNCGPHCVTDAAPAVDELCLLSDSNEVDLCRVLNEQQQQQRVTTWLRLSPVRDGKVQFRTKINLQVNFPTFPSSWHILIHYPGEGEP